MSNLERITEVILSSPSEPFETIWFRCEMMGNSPAIACFIQPKADPKTVRNHSNVHDRISDLRGLLLANREQEARESKKVWSTLTIILKGTGEPKVELSFENLKKVNTFELLQNWRAKHLAGLKFIRDKH